MLKILVCIDGDGHFRIASVVDRPKVIKALLSIEDGDFWANEIMHSNEDLLNMSNELWLETLTQLQTRGRMELLDVAVLLQ